MPICKTSCALSIVIRVVGGAALLERCLNHLCPQVQGQSIEIIVPMDTTLADTFPLVLGFSQARLVDMGLVRTDAPGGTHTAAHELYDRRAASGLAAARGEIVAMIEDTVVPAPDWCEQVFEVHKLPYEIVGGAVEHLGKTPLNWAVYFHDFGRYQLPLDEGPADYLTDVNISYKRSVLDRTRDLWSDRYNEVVLHWALLEQGTTLWLSPRIVVMQDRGILSFGEMLAERFHWGRLFGSMRRCQQPRSRLLYVLAAPLIPVLLMGRMFLKVFTHSRSRTAFLSSLPHNLALTLAWSVGEVTGFVSGLAFPRQPNGRGGVACTSA